MLVNCKPREVMEKLLCMAGAFFPFWLVISGSKFLLISCAVSEGQTTEVRSTDHDGQSGAIFLSSP